MPRFLEARSKWPPELARAKMGAGWSTKLDKLTERERGKDGHLHETDECCHRQSRDVFGIFAKRTSGRRKIKVRRKNGSRWERKDKVGRFNLHACGVNKKYSAREGPGSALPGRMSN